MTLPLLILFILFADLFFFTLLVVAVTLLGLREFYGMSLPAGRRGEKLAATAFGAGAVPLMLCPQPAVTRGLPVLAFFLFALVFLRRHRDLTTAMPQLGLVLLGLLYLALPLGHLALLRGLPGGREWIFLVLVIIMSNDTVAYFIGSAFGRRKLYPSISPNKSVEGAVGGLFGGLFGAILGKFLFIPWLAWYDCLVLALVLGICGQLGDLFESMVKRSFGVKDSGTLIPGHGGILDRLDSLIFAFPPAYYYALLRFSG